VPRRASGSPRCGAAATDAAPGMVEAILDGWQLEGVTLPGLMEGVPVGWGAKSFIGQCMPPPNLNKADASGSRHVVGEHGVGAMIPPASRTWAN
jgi:hypothetical protein